MRQPPVPIHHVRRLFLQFDSRPGIDLIYLLLHLALPALGCDCFLRFLTHWRKLRVASKALVGGGKNYQHISRRLAFVLLQLQPRQFLGYDNHFQAYLI